MNISRRLYEFIVDEYERWGYIPSQSTARQMFSGMTEYVDLHLLRLASEGLIGLGVGDDDSISLSPTYPDVRTVPLRNPLAVDLKNVEPLCSESTVALNLRGAGIVMHGDYHAQVVTDDSMIDAGLMHGDIALMLETPPNRGDIVAVEIEGKVLLRRYVILSSIPHLLAENPLQPDLFPAWEFGFKGVLWGLIRTTPRPLPFATWQKTKIDYTMVETRDSSKKDDSNRGAHLLMDDADWRRAISRIQATGKGGAEKCQRVSSPKKNKKCQSPVPPPMIGLNDQKASEYCSGNNKLICDEKPDGKYHQGFTDAVENFRRERSNI